MEPEETCARITGSRDVIEPGPLLHELARWSENEIDTFVNCLKREADRHWSIDTQESLRFASIIQRVGEALNKPRYVALGLMAQGDALKFMGSVSAAWDALERAGEIFMQAGDRLGWARTRIGMVYISPDVDKVPAALEDAELARPVLIEHGWQDRCVFLDMNVATVYHRLGDAAQALHTYQNALDMAHSLGEKGTFLLWPIYYNMALTYVEIGSLPEAEASYQQAVSSAVERGETRNAFMAITSQASLYQMQGRYRRALTLLHEVNDRLTDRTSWDVMVVYRIMAECYLHLNRHYEARDLARQAVNGMLAQGRGNESARTLVHLATAEASLENYDAALEALDQAEPLLAKMERSIWLSRQHIQRGMIAFRQGHYAEALRQAEKVLLHAAPGSVTAAAALLLQGRVHLHQGQPQHAGRYARMALKIARSGGLTATLYQAYLLPGQIAEAAGRLIHARHCYQAAIAVLTKSQQNLTITLRPGFLQDKQEAMHALLRLHLRTGQMTEAFMVLEQAKSQVLLNYLNNQESLQWHHERTGDDETVTALLEELNRLRGQHRWYYNRVHNDAPDENTARLSQEEAVDLLRECEWNIRSITERLYLLKELAFSLRGTESLTVAEIQARLADDELLVAYYNDGSEMWAFTVEKTALQVQKLPVSVTAVDRLMDKLQANLDWALGSDPGDRLAQRLTDTYRQISQQLYEKLIGSFSGLLRSKKRLVIVPYGALHYLPFNTLYDGQAYLIEHYSIVILPSSSLLARAPVVNVPGTRIVAHSWQGAIPETQEEARALSSMQPAGRAGELYLEEEALRSVFAMSPTQVLHIAAHGEYRMDTPEFSYILLDDGQVFIDDVVQHNLRYELITLSGCETGRASILPGDELTGLWRAFLYAGAASIIASLWRVDDTLTSRLIQYFYQYLFDGASKVDALRFAQCDLLRTQTDLHPAYWGALQLLGDPGPLSAVSIP